MIFIVEYILQIAFTDYLVAITHLIQLICTENISTALTLTLLESTVWERSASYIPMQLYNMNAQARTSIISFLTLMQFTSQFENERQVTRIIIELCAKASGIREL